MYNKSGFFHENPFFAVETVLGTIRLLAALRSLVLHASAWTTQWPTFLHCKMPWWTIILILSLIGTWQPDQNGSHLLTSNLLQTDKNKLYYYHYKRPCHSMVLYYTVGIINIQSLLETRRFGLLLLFLNHLFSRSKGTFHRLRRYVGKCVCRALRHR